MLIDAPLSIERVEGKAAGTVIFRFAGPLTLHNLFKMQERLREGELPRVTILDFSQVPYMDSAGMGAVINHYVHCQNGGPTRTALAVFSQLVGQ